MIMQLYITYIWWSVGFYDKAHRRYNRPYTILYLAALVLMALSLFVPAQWIKPIAVLVIIFNYSPFIARRLLRRSLLDLSLTSSMAERLGLFTIIVFGEVALGVVNGISKADHLNFSVWLTFAFSLTIVFALWWIFFTLTSNRMAKKGFVIASLLELLCIPTLMSLGLIAVRFSHLLRANENDRLLNMMFGYAIAIFLIGINLIMGLLEYPDRFNSIRKWVRRSLMITAFILVAWSLLNVKLETQYCLLVIIGILVSEIVFLNSLYYRLIGKEKASS
jgi:low temperature requirement protein LtrA